MRSVSSAFWLALQQEQVRVAELIELSVPSGVLRWTTANHVLVSSGNSFAPLPGAAGRGAEESTDLGVGTIEFSVVNSGEFRTLVFGDSLLNAPLTVSRVIVNSPDIGRLWVFRGKLGDISYNRDEVSGQARNLFNGVAESFPNETYQDYCVWRFGSAGCGYDTSSITVSAGFNAASSTPLVVVASEGTLAGSYSPSYLERGRLTVLTGANSGQVRTIRTQTGDMMGLSHSLPYAISSGDTFSVYPGCRKRWAEDCASKYNNTVNFLGFPWIPRREQAY
jgi:uncharacterized phage protein (TIGR02218 family)